MKPLSKLGMVALGHALAFLLAGATLALCLAATDSPERQASAGMASFGDAFLFLCVFGLAALPPAAGALWALRPCRRLWGWLAALALGVALTGFAVLVACLGWRGDAADGPLQSLAMLAPVRMLFAPPLTLLFAASAVCAPLRSARIALVLATLIEALAFISLVVVLFGSVR